MKKKIAGVGLVMLVCVLVGCSAPAASTITPTSIESTEVPIQTIAATEPEHGTTAYVDYIIFKGKADAANATQADIQEAYDFIKNNVDNFFKNNGTMEKIMYYGAILEYGSSEYTQLGMDATQAVKYVYRGAESITDDATQENLRQVKEALKTE